MGKAAPEDFIQFVDSSSSSSSDEGSDGQAASDSRPGRKRSRSGSDSEEGWAKKEKDKDKEAAAGGQRCYNGAPVPPWLKGTRRLGHGKWPDVSEILNEEMARFIAYISPTPEEHQMRAWVIERMQRVLENMRLPKVRAEARCFGSFETQLYLPTSDIDMTVMLYEAGTGRVSASYTSKEAIRRFLYTLARELKQTGFSTSCEVIANARVPIIKTREAISGIAVDISINADSGMTSAAVQRSFVERVYPTSLRALVLTIKQFLYQRSMNEVYTGGMGSYAITLLAVSLLQMHPRIRSGGLDIEKNMGVLLIEFFELYGKRFNYDNTCVSVLDKGRYLDKRAKGFFSPTQPYLLAIEDPNDPTNDVTKGTYGITRIKQTFAGAYDLLNNSIFAYHQTRKFGKPINDTLRAIAGAPSGDAPSSGGQKRARGRDGRAHKRAPADSLVFNDDPWAPVSFLSSIIDIDHRIIAMRARLVRTFHSGAMQKALGVQYQPQLVNALPAALRPRDGDDPLGKSSSSNSGGGGAQDNAKADFDFGRMASEAKGEVVVFVSDTESGAASECGPNWDGDNHHYDDDDG
ncbi:hypothetical protein H4R18_005126 [Coemansia javaensis]|uniref:polynucleotide adenylyltransferase n=1 Tax=Coemansia javaensis TaxID=2761396 RepID=A0A9W8H467_9FUNG|nr:hypothetical protein H4R18_005126 [Coemansia javaensis]